MKIGKSIALILLSIEYFAVSLFQNYQVTTTAEKNDIFDRVEKLSSFKMTNLVHV